jgi:hypothetical protein
MKCLWGKHTWVIRIAYNGAQYQQCSICGTKK